MDALSDDFPHDGPHEPRRRRTPLLVAGLGALVVAFVVAGLTFLVPSPEVASLPQDKSAPETFAPGTPTRESAVNPIYERPVPDPEDCPLPALDPHSRSSWEPFLEHLGECLHDLWGPILAEGAAEPDPPLLRVDPGAGPEASEGTGSGWHTLASYQSGQITIMHESVTAMADAMSDAGEDAIWVALVAHEYGHYLQDHAGILAHAWEREQNAASEDEATTIRRRGELQADCLGGVALRALGYRDEATVDTVTASLLGGGDSLTHGSSNNRRRWLLLGWHADEVGDCNAYAADSEFVR